MEELHTRIGMWIISHPLTTLILCCWIAGAVLLVKMESPADKKRRLKKEKDISQSKYNRIREKLRNIK